MSSNPLNFRRRPGGYLRARITPDVLLSFVKILPNFGRSRDDFAYGLAGCVIVYWFGLDWFNKYIPEKPKKLDFVNTGSDDISALTSMRRLINLAEMLYNLQSIPGVDAVFDDIAHGKIESAFSELEVGKLLRNKKRRFWYVIPSTKARESYDIKFRFPNGKQGCAEIKSKIETSTPSINGIKNQLQKAREGLPKEGMPCVIFLKLPTQWFFDLKAVEFAVEAAVEYLRGTTKIVSVVLLYSIDTTDFGGVHTVLHAVEIGNQGHSFDKSLTWGIIEGANAPKDTWLDFGEFVEANKDSISR